MDSPPKLLAAPLAGRHLVFGARLWANRPRSLSAMVESFRAKATAKAFGATYQRVMGSLSRTTRLQESESQPSSTTQLWHTQPPRLRLAHPDRQGSVKEFARCSLASKRFGVNAA